MADRPTFRLEFGGSVERKVGQGVVDPSTFRDLRNVSLFEGRMAVRKGLTRSQLLASDTHVIAEHPLRGRAKLMVVSWNSATGECSLWLCDHDGANPYLITATLLSGGFGYAAAGEPMPRIIMADLYDRVFIAHDEPLLWKRMRTQIFSFAHNRLLDPVFLGDVGFTTPDDVAIVPKFRGVKRHLNYLVGWGWGNPGTGPTFADADEDRGEILRTSIAGEPTIFDLRHYAIVGARGEPIIMADPAGDVLLVKKPTDIYKLVGDNPRNFGVLPVADPHFGQVISRLSVTVGGINYFWSHVGPRRSGGDVSADLALPLDLGGPSPDALATSADAETAFACYDPDEREVIFCFGQWAYVLHLAEEPTLKWSFRRYAVTLFAGVVSYSQSVANMEGLPLGTVQFGAPGFVSAQVDQLTWWIETLGAFGPWDAIEYWVKEIGIGGAVWHRVKVKLAERAFNAMDLGRQITGLDAGMKYDMALRIVRSAVPGATYTNANPALWPAVAVKIADANAHTLLPVPVLDFDNVDDARVAFPPGYSYDPVSKMLFVAIDALPEGSDSYVTFEVDGANGVGGWTALPVLSDGHSPVTVFGHNTPGHQILTIDATAMDTFTRDVRIRRKTVHDTTAYLTILAIVFV